MNFGSITIIGNEKSCNQLISDVDVTGFLAHLFDFISSNELVMNAKKALDALVVLRSDDDVIDNVEKICSFLKVPPKLSSLVNIIDRQERISGDLLSMMCSIINEASLFYGLPLWIHTPHFEDAQWNVTVNIDSGLLCVTYDKINAPGNYLMISLAEVIHLEKQAFLDWIANGIASRKVIKVNDATIESSRKIFL